MRYVDIFLCNSGGRGWLLDRSGSRRSSALTVDLSLGAVAGDMAGLAASVAGFSSRVQWAAVRGGAVTGDVAQLAASIALHGLSLAVSSKVIRATALVAGGRAGASSVSAPKASISATGSTGSTAHSWVGAVTGQVTSEATAVAATAGSGTAQAKSWAIGLDMSKTLAVVALLGLSSAGMWASVGLVAGLLAYNE